MKLKVDIVKYQPFFHNGVARHYVQTQNLNALVQSQHLHTVINADMKKKEEKNQGWVGCFTSEIPSRSGMINRYHDDVMLQHRYMRATSDLLSQVI